jgi:hypothetical protein
MTMCAAADSLAMPAVANADDFLLGKTYGEWAAKWWQWAFKSHFAQFTTGRVDCSAGQSGPVWFLAGSFGESDVRTCRDPIPYGKTLLFPLVNYGFWNPDPSCPQARNFNCTVEQKRANANGFFSDQIPGNFNGDTPSYACQLSATVDDAPVQNRGYGIVRTQSPVFPLEGTDANGNPVSDPKTIDDGYYVAIPPLGRGVHTIHFTGGICSFGDSPHAINPPPNGNGTAAPIFKVDVTYRFDVR